MVNLNFLIIFYVKILWNIKFHYFLNFITIFKIIFQNSLKIDIILC
jgi:hypothetical protein